MASFLCSLGHLPCLSFLCAGSMAWRPQETQVRWVSNAGTGTCVWSCEEESQRGPYAPTPELAP